MNDVCSATVADARRLRARMGWSPSGANQRRRCHRAAQILRTEAIMSLSGVTSGPQGFQPDIPRRALLKHILALCIVIFEFEIGCSRKRVVFSLFLSFMFVWTFMELRTICNDIHIWATIGDNPSIKNFKGIQAFSQDTGREIGEGSWSVDKLKWPARSIVPYELAEKKFHKNIENPNVDIIISHSGDQLIRKNGKKK